MGGQRGVPTHGADFPIEFFEAGRWDANGNRSKNPDKKPPGQKPHNIKPPRIIEEIIAKYAVDANLFRLHGVYQPVKPGEPGNLREFFNPGILREISGNFKNSLEK